MDEPLDCSEDTGTPVGEDYRLPFTFAGTLNGVTVRLGDHALAPLEEEGIRNAKTALCAALVKRARWRGWP